LQATFDAPAVAFAAGEEKRQLVGLAGSASLKSDLLTISVVNPHATLPIEATLDFQGATLDRATISALTHSELTAHNTFDSPQILKPTTQPWEQTSVHVFPPASVTVFTGRLTGQ
jgi:alpha-N-arabinofuranosidase